VATKTLYLTSTEVSTKIWRLDEAAPSSDNEATSVLNAKIAAGNYFAFVPGVGSNTTSSGSFIVADGDGAHGWRSQNTYSGVFASGNWSIAYKVEQVTKYAHSGRLVCNVYRTTSANPASGDLTLMNSSLGQSNIIDLGTTAGAEFTGTITVAVNQNLTLSNAYIFVVFNWLITTAGANATCAVDIHCNQGAAEKVTTADFTATVVATGSAALTTKEALVAAAKIVKEGEASLKTTNTLTAAAVATKGATAALTNSASASQSAQGR
jgi:hypothetical protein